VGRDAKTVNAVTIIWRPEMVVISKHEAESLVRCIEDQSNGPAADKALEIRDRWLLEDELGINPIPQEIRAILEGARL